MSDAVLEVAVKALVRLALMNERTKQFLKREDIVKTCIPDQPRRFNELLKATNDELDAVFGMKLVPVAPNPKLSVPASLGLSSHHSRKQAVNQNHNNTHNKQPQKYALVSTLDSREREKVAENRLDHVSVELGLLALTLCYIRLGNGQMLVDDLVKIFKSSFAGLEDACGRPYKSLLDDWLKAKYLQLHNSRPDADGELVGWGPRSVIEFPQEALVYFVMAISDILTRTDSNDADGDTGEGSFLQQRLTASLM